MNTNPGSLSEYSDVMWDTMRFRALNRSRWSVVIGLVLTACNGGDPVDPPPGDGRGVPSADVTFVFDAVPDSVVRIDIAVTGSEMSQINGSFDPTSGADRVTITVPLGDRRNAFARGFNAENLINYIGEVNFALTEETPVLFHVPFNYKGEHFPGSPAVVP